MTAKKKAAAEKSKMTFRCWFKIRGIQASVDHPRGLTFFESGFWVDSSYQLNVLVTEEVYWVPPHQILYVEKIKE